MMQNLRQYLLKTLLLVILCEAFSATAAPQQTVVTSGAGDGSQARLTPTFMHNPSRIDLTLCGRIVASYPLLEQPGYPRYLAAILDKIPPSHIVNPAGTVVYVVETGSKSAKVSAFDLTSGAALGSVEVAAATRTLQFDSNATRLIAFGSGESFLKGEEQHTSVVTVIEPVTLKVEFAGSFGQLANMMRYVGQLDRMLVLDSTKTSLWFIDPRAAATPAPIQLGGVSAGIIVSADGTRLLTLVRNTNKSGKKAIKGGALNQFDVATGKLLHTSEKLGDAMQLVRLGDGDEYWVTTNDGMQRVTQEGEQTGAAISYEKQDTTSGRALGGLPGPSLDFGKRLAIEVINRDGTLSHKVALIDPDAGRVESVVPIGRAGVRRGKAAKRWGLALALNAAMGAAGGAASVGAHPMTAPVMVPVFLPGNASSVSGMVVGANDKTMYVMDAESDDVTAVNPDGAVADILPIKSDGSARLWRSPRSPFVYHFGSKVITVISDENKIVKEIPIAKGFSAVPISVRNEFYLCNEISCEIWNALTATSVQTTDRRKLGIYLAHVDEAAADAETGDQPGAATSCLAGAAQAVPAQTVSLSPVSISSDITGADIEVDGNFSGNTPSTLQLSPGRHSIKVSRGSMIWQREVNVLAGSSQNLNAVLGIAPQ